MSSRSRNILLAAIAALACVALVLALVLLPPRPGQPDPAPAPSPVGTTNRYTPTEALDMTVSVIDVGQGDATLIESEGHVLLVDAGDIGKGDAVVAYLRSEGIQAIDYVVATHPHSDHIGGMPEVFDAFEVQNDVLAPALTTDKPAYAAFAAAVEAEPDVALSTPVAGSVYQLGDAVFTVLRNGDGADEGDPNTASLVIKVTCSGRSVLLTGDLPGSGENRLVSEGAPLASDVLSVGHHGSATSSTEAFLDAVHPRYAAISCGANNRYGHPKQSALDRLAAIGAEVYRTDEQGTVVFDFSDGSVAPRLARAA